MRFSLLLLVLLMNVSVAKSQVIISLIFGDKLNSDKLEFGLEGGENFSTIKGLEGNTLAKFNLGFYFDISLRNPAWKVHTGVIVKSSVGTSKLPTYLLNDAALDSAFAEGSSIERKINYFYVPVMMKYSFKNRIFLEGGIQLGLRSKATDTFERSVIDKQDLSYTKDIRDDYHRLDGGFAAGLGYRFMKGNGMNVTAYYYYGIVDISIDDATANQFNRSIYITLGIPIGKGKAKSAESIP